MSCCICGTVKNCEPYLDKVFKNIEIIGSLFNDYKIVLYYDKSNDNTLEKLKTYKNKNPKLNIYVNNITLSTYRTHNISNGRNKCLEYIRKICSDYEMFIMMDMDDVNCKEINIEILKKYLKREDWDALSFNTSPKYYDIWALSIYPYYLSFFAFENTDEMSKIMFYHITNLLTNLPSGELLKCASAFNGFSIYKTDKFINCNYDGRLRLDLLPFKQIFKNNNVYNSNFKINTLDDCEHRAFHLEAINKNNARIRISPEILFN